MLITKTSPVGIDWHIQKLQTLIHNRLISADYWNIDSADYRCYGRCYRNKTDDGYVAQNYESGNDYREVYWDDSLKAISFFGTGNTVQIDMNAQADVHLVFFADVVKLAPTILHRADEEIKQDVLDIIGKNAHGFSVQSVETSLENVLKEYPGSRRDNRLKYVDMHPVHCFRINMRLIYNPNKIC